MKAVVLTLSLAAACWAGDPGKAACNSHNTGQLWPDEANTDSGVARRTAQTGELEVCSFTGWRYKWKPVSVNYSRLSKGKSGNGTKPVKPAAEDDDASAAAGKVSRSFR